MTSLTVRKFIQVIPIPLLLLAGCGGSDSYTGYIEGEYVYIASSQSGRLKELSVRRGDWVKPESPLFQLETDSETFLADEAKQNLEAAEAQLENLKKGKRDVEVTALKATLEQAKILQNIAETRFNRNHKLAKTGAVSQDQFDESQSVFERSKSDVIEKEAELELGLMGAREDEITAANANVKAKQEELDLALWKISEKKLLSEVNAYVQDTLYRTDEWIPAGKPVISLLPPENIKARFFIPQKDLAKMQIGQEVSIDCDSCKKPLSAKINYISSEAEFTPPVIFSRESREKLVFMIEAKMEVEDAKLLHPGQPIEIHVRH